MDRKQAQEHRDRFDALEMVRGTKFGEELFAKFDEIEKSAIDKAMRGDTPENNVAYYENRGRLKAVQQLRQLVTDIETKNTEAVAILGNDVVEDAPADTSKTTEAPSEDASEKSE